MATKAKPPKKSCGPLTHDGMTDLSGARLGTSLIVTFPFTSIEARRFRQPWQAPWKNLLPIFREECQRNQAFYWN
jgi:hypothetical protein